MNDGPTNAPGLSQAHVLPAFTGIRRLVDAVADQHVASNEGFTGPGPHLVRVRGCDGQGSDGLRCLVVEDGPAVRSAVLGLPDTTRASSGVVDVGVVRVRNDGAHPIALRPDEPPVQGLGLPGAGPRLGYRRAEGGKKRENEQREPTTDAEHSMNRHRFLHGRMQLARAAHRDPYRKSRGSATRGCTVVFSFYGATSNALERRPR